MNGMDWFALVGVLGLVGGLVFVGLGAWMRMTTNRVIESGVSTEATITKRDITGSTKSTSRYLTYQFDVVGADGKTLAYTQKQSVNQDNYDSLPEGSQAPIRYLPSDPARTARLTGIYMDNSDSTGALSLGGGCLIAAVFILIVAGTTIQQAAQKAKATAAQVATAGSDINAVRAAIEPHIPTWQQVKDRAIHLIMPAEVGLDNAKLYRVAYGYCTDNTFYVYVPKPMQEGRTPNIHYSDAYTYTSQPADYCWPPGWIVLKRGDLGNGWTLTMVMLIDPTATPSPQ
ncbi:MAG: DUF3592 domain-containing protein [Anaerolineae bacterium]|nr:DUF3592 domain-containing protein [Anaerolineae bacterium]